MTYDFAVGIGNRERPRYIGREEQTTIDNKRAVEQGITAGLNRELLEELQRWGETWGNIRLRVTGSLLTVDIDGKVGQITRLNFDFVENKISIDQRNNSLQHPQWEKTAIITQLPVNNVQRGRINTNAAVFGEVAIEGVQFNIGVTWNGKVVMAPQEPPIFFPR